MLDRLWILLSFASDKIVSDQLSDNMGSDTITKLGAKAMSYDAWTISSMRTRSKGILSIYMYISIFHSPGSRIQRMIVIAPTTFFLAEPPKLK